MPSCPQGLRGGWRVGRGRRGRKRKPLLFAFATTTTSVKGVILKGKRVWICIVPVRFVLVPRAGIEPTHNLRSRF